MSPLQMAHANPFGITKAVDLNDEQILSLWVDVSGEAGDFAEFARPSSPMPTFIMGAKGSGKTHMMRYHSFELQSLRYKRANTALRQGIAADRYLGIYMRCSGLNSGRFAKKGQTDEVWKDLFAYYIELWLTQHLLHVLLALDFSNEEGEELCSAITRLFDKWPGEVPRTLIELRQRISDIQRNLDFEVNNCVLTGKINAQILATRGQLVFGIPKLLATRFSFLKDVLFVYSIDEFENLTESQQRLVNTLVREKELPATLRIGSRLYGVKTHATDSAEEENLQDSEFESIFLDQLFRKHKGRYSTFAKRLIEKRLVSAYGLTGDASKLNALDVRWSEFFEVPSEDWNSEAFLQLVNNRPSHERRHFLALREKLALASVDTAKIASVIENLSVADCPLLEKTNILLLYQDISKGGDPLGSSAQIRGLARSFIDNPSPKGRYGQTLDHYKNDLIAQLRRENDSKQCYLGLDTFIAMSAGLPRALLTILRSVFEWSLFNGEDPLRKYRISLGSQQRGVKDASDWFYDNMRKAGEDGLAIQTAIDRLAQLFRVNRFADKPVECSLITFSVAEEDASKEALRILRLCESRSFLNRIAGGQRERNSERVTMKFQLNNMLSPRWDLPLGRRGAISLDAKSFDAIFDVEKREQFEELLIEWRDRMTAPHFGKARVKPNQQRSLL